MDNKTMVWLGIGLLVLVIFLCVAFVVAPISALIAENRQTLINDVADLENIARAMDEQRELRFFLYREYDWNGFDYLALAFPTPLSCEQIAERLVLLELLPAEEKDRGGPPQESSSFLADNINRYNKLPFVTYNHSYQQSDFDHTRTAAPWVSGWRVKNRLGGDLDVICAERNRPEDQWFVNEQSFLGSIIRLSYDRTYHFSSAFFQDHENAGIVQHDYQVGTPVPSVMPSQPP